MEKIYVIVAKGTDYLQSQVVDDKAQAKSSYENFFSQNPALDIKVIEMDRVVFYNNVAANYKLSAFLSDGVIISPLSL